MKRSDFMKRTGLAIGAIALLPPHLLNITPSKTSSVDFATLLIRYKQSGDRWFRDEKHPISLSNDVIHLEFRDAVEINGIIIMGDINEHTRIPPIRIKLNPTTKITTRELGVYFP